MAVKLCSNAAHSYIFFEDAVTLLGEMTSEKNLAETILGTKFFAHLSNF